MRWNKTAKITGTGPPLFFLYYIFHLLTFLEAQTGFWLFSTAFLSFFVFFFFLLFLLLRKNERVSVCVCASLEEKRSRWVAVPDHLHLVLSIFTSYDVQCTERGQGALFLFILSTLFYQAAASSSSFFFYIFLINLLRVFLLYNFFFKDPISPSCVPDFEFLPRLLLDPPFVNLHQVAIIIQLPCKVSNSFFLLEKLVWPHTQNLFGYERKTKGEEGGGGKSRNGLKIALWRVE